MPDTGPGLNTPITEAPRAPTIPFNLRLPRRRVGRDNHVVDTDNYLLHQVHAGKLATDITAGSRHWMRNPRKSNPSLMCMIRVLAWESRNPNGASRPEPLQGRQGDNQCACRQLNAQLCITRNCSRETNADPSAPPPTPLVAGRINRSICDSGRVLLLDCCCR